MTNDNITISYEAMNFIKEALDTSSILNDMNTSK